MVWDEAKEWNPLSHINEGGCRQMKHKILSDDGPFVAALQILTKSLELPPFLTC